MDSVSTATCLRRSRAIFESKGACVRKGTLIDATVIGSASNGSGIARGRPRMATRPTLRPPRTAASSAAARRPRPTPSIIPDEPGEVYADRAYDALAVEKAIEARDGTVRLLRKGHRWLAAATLEAHNRPLRPIRARIEKIFCTWKRSYHFR